jgi:hypothetical protein
MTMPTQALKTALHVPATTPVNGDAVIVRNVTSDGVPETEYGAAGGATTVTGLPAATAEGQFLLAGTAPNFPPVWGDGDAGRY